MITGNETIKELLNKRWSKKDYNTDNDTYINSLLYGYLNLNADKNGCIEIDNEFVVEIASFLDDCEHYFFNDDFIDMFCKAKDKIWNGDYAWEGTTKFNLITHQYEVEITDEQYYYQCKMDDMIDEDILNKRCNE